MCETVRNHIRVALLDGVPGHSDKAWCLGFTEWRSLALGQVGESDLVKC